MISRVLRAPVWRSLVFLFLLSAHASAARADSLTLAWDASASPDVAGYTIAYGTQSGHYTKWLDVGNTTIKKVPLMDPLRGTESLTAELLDQSDTAEALLAKLKA